MMAAWLEASAPGSCGHEGGASCPQRRFWLSSREDKVALALTSRLPKETHPWPGRPSCSYHFPLSQDEEEQLYLPRGPLLGSSNLSLSPLPTPKNLDPEYQACFMAQVGMHRLATQDLQKPAGAGDGEPYLVSDTEIPGQRSWGLCGVRVISSQAMEGSM